MGGHLHANESPNGDCPGRGMINTNIRGVIVLGRND